MEEFINGQYMVYCSTNEENQEFWNLCKEYNLEVSRRGNFRKDIANNNISKATWVCNFMGEGTNIVSWWNLARYAEGGIHTIDYPDFINKINTTKIDTKDFLMLLA